MPVFGLLAGVSRLFIGLVVYSDVSLEKAEFWPYALSSLFSGKPFLPNRENSCQTPLTVSCVCIILKV